MKNILRLSVCLLLCIGMSKCSCSEQLGTTYIVNAYSNHPSIKVDSLIIGITRNFESKVKVPDTRNDGRYPPGYGIRIWQGSDSDTTRFTLLSNETIIYDTTLTFLEKCVPGQKTKHISLNFYFEADSTLTIRQTEVASKSQQAHLTL